MAELYWLKRPIAHRGLHDPSKGIVENSASSVRAAMGAGFAIEVDLQCAAGHMFLLRTVVDHLRMRPHQRQLAGDDFLQQIAGREQGRIVDCT